MLSTHFILGSYIHYTSVVRYAWPPHQIMTWVGLERYGYLEEAQRLAYRWLYMMTTAFVDFNGVVPEKFDAVKLSHLVDAEYGNQGIDFKMVPREGFGWMNGTFCPVSAPASGLMEMSL